MNEIKKAVEVLKKGGVVVYPTDTAYGLAVDATNLIAVKKLYRLKGRDFKKPIHIIISKYFDTLVYRSNVHSRKLMKKFWPGPLTLVLPINLKGKSWRMLSGGTGTIGIRYPDHPIPQALVELFGKPITTTSANLSGQPNTYSVEEVKKQFTKSKLKPNFYLGGGRLRKRKPSTVVAIVNNSVKILREGPITETEIKAALAS